MWDGVWTVARRELLVSGRQGVTYQWRVTAALGGLLAILAAHGIALRGAPSRWDEIPAGAARLGMRFGLFGLLLVAGGLLLGITARLAGSSVAGERETKSLDSLLASPLSSAEIVGGKLLACGVRCLMGLLAMLPLLVLLVGLGAASWSDAGLGLLILATAFALLAAIGMAVSVRMPTVRAAVTLTILLIVAWLEAPFLIAMAGPRLFPAVYTVVRPVNVALLDSGPLRLLAARLGAVPSTNGDLAIVLRMTAWQLGIGLLLGTWVCLRLRSLSRRLAGGDATRLGGRPAHAPRRPPCGDEPMEWKERHVTHNRLGTRITMAIVWGCAFLLIGTLTYSTAKPAFREWVEAGYGWSAPMYARWEFNQAFLRPISAVFCFILLILLAGMTSESLDLERKNDTWTVLLSTPLGGEEIVRAKRNQALRRCRPILGMIILIWLVGVVIGALHPVGLLLGLWALYALVRLALAQGAFAGVCNAQVNQSTDRAVAWLMALMIATPAPCLLTGYPASIPLAALSPPIGTILALLSHNEAQAAFGGEAFVGLRLLHLDASYSTALWTTGSAMFVPLVVLALAHLLERRAITRFDRTVGRPTRPA